MCCCSSGGENLLRVRGVLVSKNCIFGVSILFGLQYGRLYVRNQSAWLARYYSVLYKYGNNGYLLR